MKILDIFNNFNPYQLEIKQPYIIAEAGVNHEGKMELAKRLINEAKQGGADAIKFQTYKANTLASKNSPAYWDRSKEPTGSQYELFKKYDKFWKNEFEQLKKYCDEVGIEFISTPFDVESATYLNDLMNVFKISSSDITNKPFIEYMCGFGKPVLLSTGASYMYEVEEAVQWIDAFNLPVALLHCILNYPTADENANLGMIRQLKQKFPDRIIGYSDHTLPGENMKIVELSALLGAVIIEKHFTFDKTLPGNDHYHAMDYKDLMKFRKNYEETLSMFGSVTKTVLESEEISRKNARRSLIALHDIAKGKTITKDDLTWKRPAFGISPKMIDEVVGKKASRNIVQDEIFYWNMIG
ncbi:MAG: acetylneuraminic acid synthetase [Bacteroidetes bacterium 4484_276]|jgi:N-acetylneuraminate synthase|nr:MAG: acetylneuraminic acid synthetase [Bacteroidetes bacterium 4484_276]